MHPLNSKKIQARKLFNYNIEMIGFMELENQQWRSI